MDMITNIHEVLKETIDFLAYIATDEEEYCSYYGQDEPYNNDTERINL